MKISKCCESKVKIFKGDMGWNIVCENCGKECDFIEIPNKCQRCENYGNSKGKPKIKFCDMRSVCPVGNKQVSTNLKVYYAKNFWYKLFDMLGL